MRPNTDPLSVLLRRADPAGEAVGPAPADFAVAVHARIRSADTARRSFRSILARLPYPLAAALALAASLGAGSSLALARDRGARTETFAAAYARSIDPLRMHPAGAETHVHSHAH